jgi:hypothetical protein
MENQEAWEYWNFYLHGPMDFKTLATLYLDISCTLTAPLSP